jgi:hypothetical protein
MSLKHQVVIIPRFFTVLVIALSGCTPARLRTEPPLTVTLARGGGLSGISETIHIWEAGSNPRANAQRSNEEKARIVQLPGKTLDSALVMLENFANAAPVIPSDTGSIRPLCGDAILTRVQVRRGKRVQVVQEECPHRTRESEIYWQRVNSLFQLLAGAAR